MMRKSMVALGFVVAAAAFVYASGPSTAEACNRCRSSRCGYSSCGSSCYSGGCSTCYAPSSCGTCYTACAPTCAPACTTSCSTCAPACNTCYAPSSCCGNGYYYSYRAQFSQGYVASRSQPYYYTTSPAPVATPVYVQRSNVVVTPVRYEARRTSLFGW